jgi:2-polyprenyl-6-methoxyphenol hydroxylase-like FAD-dependent oxidoreductase
MPQWDFLDFLAREAQRFPGFSLGMEAEVTGLLHEGDRVVGVRADTPEGEVEVYADLVVGADGRSSTVRAAAGLQVETLGAPMDVLWFRLPHAAGDPEQAFGVFGTGEILVLIARGDHWQCGYVIPKDGFDALRTDALARFRGRIAALAPFLADRMTAVTDWEEVKLLTVAVDRLRTWSRPGLLCIGDAAHAMSPIGGVGINLAIQDAVAAANLLFAKLRTRKLTQADLDAVQRRRAWAAHATQRLQVLVQNRIIAPVLHAPMLQGGAQSRPPLPLRLLARLPWLRRLPARLIGLGLRPEHVAAPLRAVP